MPPLTLKYMQNCRLTKKSKCLFRRVTGREIFACIYIYIQTYMKIYVHTKT